MVRTLPLQPQRAEISPSPNYLLVPSDPSARDGFSDFGAMRVASGGRAFPAASGAGSLSVDEQVLGGELQFYQQLTEKAQSAMPKRLLTRPSERWIRWRSRTRNSTKAATSRKLVKGRTASARACTSSRRRGSIEARGSGAASRALRGAGGASSWIGFVTAQGLGPGGGGDAAAPAPSLSIRVSGLEVREAYLRKQACRPPPPAGSKFVKCST